MVLTNQSSLHTKPVIGVNTDLERVLVPALPDVPHPGRLLETDLSLIGSLTCVEE